MAKGKKTPDELRALRDQSEAYSDSSSDLSDRLKWIEEQLANLPGKFELSINEKGVVQDRGNGAEFPWELTFGRLKGQWRLYIWEHDEEEGKFEELPLVNAGIHQKIEYAPLVAILVRELCTQLRERVVALIAAHEALDVAEALILDAQREVDGAATTCTAEPPGSQSLVDGNKKNGGA